MKNKIVKTKKKYTRRKKLPSQTIKELENEVERLSNITVELNRNNREFEKAFHRSREYTQNLELELAMLREKNLNFIEAINVISRAERLRIQGNLWGDNNLQAVATQKDPDNYFDANS